MERSTSSCFFGHLGFDWRGNPLLIAHLTPSLERLASWFYFHVEVALYDDFTPQSHGLVPCLHTCGGISCGFRLLMVAFTCMWRLFGL
jgi:hypothetical protein